ncbi:MAG: SusD/RagB family nutrient-binding outer membrane lipoprotein [Lunatimonas sp.]|uniref:SusD/RagB family nutrient-binding outer membrane lipoprotein n=1 Tax=Lunatimonas sp. TaxID=2060141 RepID=UPI00263B9CF3|nr:SusD/RagB family nutrient-binding outer membrane lipoprotein [Lunatimonas sp.]MCC5935884.1 SusD/RagB family nutrient-binding outer membrane lipoprotein [Lunatimonas sp.]
MKNLLKALCISLIVLSPLTSCDNGFDEMNINPVQPTALDPIYLMNRAALFSTISATSLNYEAAIVQQIVSPNGGVLAGGNFNQLNRAFSIGTWNKYYRDVLKHTVDVKRFTRDNPDRNNLYQMSRILHAMSAMILTDTFGDVPYFEAGLGFLEGKIDPVYDRQEDIYLDVLNELQQATAALNPSGRIETGDIFYGGDVVKWRKLGYSLMLRAAMRHTKVNPTRAREWVERAVTGGVMTSNADNLFIKHDFNYANELGNTLNATEANNYYLAEPFERFLSENNDPRLGSIAVRFIGAGSGPDQNNALAGNPAPGVTLSRNPADQMGFPMGFDNQTIGSVVQSRGLRSFYEFSQVDRTRMTARDAPIFHVTYSQTSLLLAEAAVRGWVAGNPADYFTQGIRANMEQMASYGPSTAIAEASINAYIAAHPLDAGNAMQQIGEQYWVASFLNGYEGFANFRRTGYPNLAPNPYPGKDISGDFIRRLSYPDAEFSVNNANIQAAVARQGPDNLDTRVWWDTP